MTAPSSPADRERLLRLLAAATFFIFFQAFMVAPLLPRLADLFGVSVAAIGLIVPAYLIPYGLATLVYGPLSDRLGREKVILASLLAFVLLTAATATAWPPTSLLVFRLLTGLGASGVVPIALTLLGDLFPFRERGRPLGWLFGAMAGGMAFGSTAGVMLEPVVGWRGLFLGVALLALGVFGLLLPRRALLRGASSPSPAPMRAVFGGYLGLVSTWRGRRTYGYVLLNAVFHSGVFTWLGLYFIRRHHLSEVEVGLGLLGYGVPGFLFGPIVGRAADRWGRNWLIPIGLAIAGISAVGLAPVLPVVAAAVLVATLSLGYDLTQPLLAGIVTDLGPHRGQAMGLNVFALFTGFGLGSVLFSQALRFGLGVALLLFGGVALAAAAAAVPLFGGEAARA